MRRLVAVCLTLTLAGVFVAVTPAAQAASECGTNPDFNGDGFDDLAIGVPEDDTAGDEAGAVNVLYGGPDGISVEGDAQFTQDVSGMADAGEDFDEFGAALASGDFDGDGRDDLAVGVTEEDVVAPFDNAGAVHIIYGSSAGLTASGDQVFHQNSTGMADSSGSNEAFGFSLAACDFDADGRDDLAIGIPGQAVDGQGSAGAIHVLFGSGDGLTASGDQVIHQDTPGIAGSAAEFDAMGESMTAGDFDGDGRGDVAVGAPEEDIIVGECCGGSVHVIYGSSTGLTSSGDQFLHQNVSGMADESELADEFGFAVAAGDFDGDGRDDLAAGVRREDTPGFQDAGAVHVIYGSSSGLSTSGDQLWHHDVSGISEPQQGFAELGFAVAAGDFDGDGRDDVAVGAPDRNAPGDSDSGATLVIYGSASGLTASGDQFLNEDVFGFVAQTESDDKFGRALSAGDFDADGSDDLVVGVPRQTVGGIQDAGSVDIVYGSPSGFTSTGFAVFNEASLGVLGDPGLSEDFGGALVGSPFTDT